MGTRLLIGGLASAVLLVGVQVGVSHGGGDGIPEPQVIELVAPGLLTNDDDRATECRFGRSAPGPARVPAVASRKGT